MIAKSASMMTLWPRINKMTCSILPEGIGETSVFLGPLETG
jgi:hypothetical protein